MKHFVGGKRNFDMGGKVKRRKIFIIVLALIAIVVAPTTSQTASPTPTATKVYTLTYCHFVSGVKVRDKVLSDDWPKLVKERSGGRLIIDTKPNIFPYKETASAVFEGRLDLGDVNTHLNGSMEPLWEAIELPGLESLQDLFNSPAIQSVVVDDILKPTLLKHNAIYLGLTAWPDRTGFSRVPIQHVEDLNNKKIRFGGPQGTKLGGAFGAKSVSITPEELIMALTRGTVDAIWTGAPWALGNKLYEPGKYISGLRLEGAAITMIAINKKSFESLPADLQKILRDATAAETFKVFQSASTREEQESIDAMVKRGATYYKPSADDLAKLAAAAGPIHAEWSAKADATSKALYQKLKAAVEAYRKGSK